MNIEPLPEYEIDPLDELIVFHLMDDETFRESIESEFGRLSKIYPDWLSDKLIYEFFDGSSKYSNLTEIVRALKDLGYLKSIMN